MKRLYDYTRDELLALTPEGIEQLKDLECIANGAPLLPPVSESPINPAVIGDEMAYKVNAEMLFFREEDANAVLALIRSFRRADEFYHGGSYRYGSPQGLKSVDPEQGSVVSERFWSARLYAEHRAAQEAYLTAKAKWEKEQQEYAEAKKARTNACDAVDSALEEAWEGKRTEDQIKQTFAQYVELAGGNIQIALQFLHKLGRWDNALVERILDLPPVEAAEAVERPQPAPADDSEPF